MPSLDSGAPLWLLEHDLNAFTAGGVADGDWPSGGLERVCKHRNACFLIVREKRIGIRGRANRRPAEATTEWLCMETPWRILLFVDIQLCVPRQPT